MSAFFRTALILVAVVTTSGTALGADPDAVRCALAAERGQQERDEGHLIESRTTFASCGEDACPAVIRKECLHWLEEVETRVPTILVSVEDAAGKDVIDAEVTIDGAPLALANQGREARLDPGQHRVAARSGEQLAEETIVVREREKGRLVRLVLEGRSPARRAPPGPERTSAAPTRHVPVASWILAGAAVVGGAGFAYFWSRGVDRVHELRSICAPRCADGDVDDAARMLDIGRVSLGVGIAAAIGAVVLYVLQPADAPRTASAPSSFDVRF